MKKEFSVKRMAGLLNVSRSGFYTFLKRKPDTIHKVTDGVLKIVKETHDSHGSCYGMQKTFHEVRKLHPFVSRLQVFRSMKVLKIGGKRRKRFIPRTTDSSHNLPISPNLLSREFSVNSPNKVWVSDITYIRTLTGWLYLCVVIDLFSRKVVGWSMQNHMHTSLVSDALDMAVLNRNPEPGLMLHSDRGSQYASHAFRLKLKNYSMIQSMSGKGNCWDNACAESFFGLMKNELPKKVFQNQSEAKAVIFDYIERFYNRKRIHGYLNYLSPEEFENLNIA
jgi:transposase InsO family protein